MKWISSNKQKRVEKLIVILLLITCSKGVTQAQEATGNTKDSKWTSHFQLTIIGQKHSSFSSSYIGKKSLADTVEPTAVSLTSTLFLGRRLWKGAAFYFNPEASGGKGLSYASGVAGALNGETYRVGEVAPQVFIARAYFQQHIPLGHTSYEHVADDVNLIAGNVPTSRITITAGRFAMSDFFDYNTYAKDPRAQFFNWSAWANGAWDYPADTRGYTYGLIAAFVKPQWSLKLSSVAVPRIANYHLMEYKFGKAHSETLELEHTYSINKHPGAFRFLISSTHSQAPSYKDGIEAVAAHDTFLLSVIEGAEEHKVYGGKKLGLGINAEQELSNSFGIFGRLGWNDGKDVSWAFTEIDRTANLGISVKGIAWKRANDVLGLVGVVNGISQDHRTYLQAGGYGFIIGDGALNYGTENIIEAYYNAQLNSFLWLTFDYQFVNHPGYNKDRGPVNVFGVRGHVAF